MKTLSVNHVCNKEDLKKITMFYVQLFKYKLNINY